MTETLDPKAATGQTWRLDADTGSMAPRSALDVLVDLNDKVVSGRVGEYQPVPLGFTPLDKTIGAGLRAGELLLLGGAQGTGKTTMALQMARNIASGGQANVLYICFEHDEQYLLNRMIAMESALAHLPHKTGAIKIQDVRKEILGTWMAEGEATAQMANNPRLRRQRQVARIIHTGLSDLRHIAAENNSDQFFATLVRLLQEQLGERLDLPELRGTRARGRVARRRRLGGAAADPGHGPDPVRPVTVPDRGDVRPSGRDVPGSR